MSLYARITSLGPDKIAVHRFGAALREWAQGQGVTRQQVIDTFVLSAAEVTELDALQTSYTNLATNNTAAILAKAQWLQRMEDVFILCETGDYTEAKAKARLGF